MASTTARTQLSIPIPVDAVAACARLRAATGRRGIIRIPQYPLTYGPRKPTPGPQPASPMSVPRCFGLARNSSYIHRTPSKPTQGSRNTATIAQFAALRRPHRLRTAATFRRPLRLSDIRHSLLSAPAMAGGDGEAAALNTRVLHEHPRAALPLTSLPSLLPCRRSPPRAEAAQVLGAVEGGPGGRERRVRLRR